MGILKHCPALDGSSLCEGGDRFPQVFEKTMFKSMKKIHIVNNCSTIFVGIKAVNVSRALLGAETLSFTAVPAECQEKDLFRISLINSLRQYSLAEVAIAVVSEISPA